VPAELKDLAKRASRILRQHHEKFDGRGFPKALRGFHVEESAQFLCMADLLLTLSEGRWDGIARTHRKSLSVLEKYESAGNFPEFFHPALFQTLSKSAPPATEEQAA
jgi:response regulator RpfG family c-di-GMP phosphodiesterase